MASEEYWEVVCAEEIFESLRGNEHFVALLVLGRITNAIRFFHLAYLNALEDETPSGKRQRINSFLFLGPALREGLNYANTLGKHFNDHDAFTCFREFLQRVETKAYREGIVRDLRNTMAFHFDEVAMRNVLSRLEFEAPMLCTGLGRAVGNSYYDLADEAAVHSVLVTEAGDVRSWDELEGLMKDTAELSAEFGRCADRLIGAVSQELGWKLAECT